MRLLFIILFPIALSAQKVDTVRYYNADSLMFYNIIRNDTTFGVSASGVLQWYKVDKQDITTVFKIENNNQVITFRIITTHGRQVVSDGRCNGIKADGTRCTRLIKIGTYYCWQHD